MIKLSNDEKSNLMAITSNTTDSIETFAIPEELQQKGFHKEASKITIYNLVKTA